MWARFFLTHSAPSLSALVVPRLAARGPATAPPDSCLSRPRAQPRAITRPPPPPTPPPRPRGYPAPPPLFLDQTSPPVGRSPETLARILVPVVRVAGPGSVTACQPGGSGASPPGRRWRPPAPWARAREHGFALRGGRRRRVRIVLLRRAAAAAAAPDEAHGVRGGVAAHEHRERHEDPRRDRAGVALLLAAAAAAAAAARARGGADVMLPSRSVASSDGPQLCR